MNFNNAFIILVLFAYCSVSHFISCDSLEISEGKRILIDTVTIDSLMMGYDFNDSPGASIVIIEGGQIIFSKGYGLAKLDNAIPVSELTNFRLASISKQFTAMAIMILYSRDKLDYDQTLTDFFPDFPNYGTSITIRHLLHHTSGLRDYFTLVSDTVKRQLKDDDVLELMMAQNSTYFPPGTEYRYSNSGYALLALVVEHISNQSFADFLYENIFLQIGMNNSLAYEKNISIIDNRAMGYKFLNGAFVLNDQSLTSAVLGDGGIYSSVKDLATWDNALYTSQLVPYGILNEAFISGTISSGSEIGYGFGWVIDNYLYRERVSHTGSTAGFKNVYHRYPNERLSIIILTNRSSGSPKDIADSIAESIF